MNKLRSIFPLFLCGFLLSAGPARSQSLRGSIVGRVMDASNKPLADADVVLVDEETDWQRTAKTSANGEFAATVLPAGTYRVEASIAGYRSSSRVVVLLVDQEIYITIPLLPARSVEHVEVSTESGLLNTESATVSTVIQNREILNLPLDGRNSFELALLVPGSVPAAQGSAGSVRGAFTFNMNGAREDANNFLLDGVIDEDPKLNGFAIAPPVDAVREYEVLSNAYDASFGRNVGAQVNVLLQSGTNKFHGTVYEFLRNAALDTTNYFAPPDEATPQDVRNQFGGSLGGPIRKDRTFFFVDYEGLRIREGITQTTNVPTALERVGNFSQSSLVPINLATGQPFPNSVIPPAQMSPVALAIAALYPLPNLPATEQNYVSSPTEKDRSDQFDLRLDHSLSKSSELSFHYCFSDADLFEPYGDTSSSPLVPGYGNNVPGRAQNVMLSETHIFSPNFLNEVRLGFDRVSLQVNQQNQNNNLNQAVGLPTPWMNPRDTGLTQIVVSGFSTLGDEINNPQQDTSNIYELTDNASWSHGGHLVKFGADLRLLQQNAFADVESRGLIDFSGFTGNALAEMLQDAPSYTLLAQLNNPQHLRSQSYNFYAQDQWRARPSFTLTLGLRYEYNTPAVDPHNRASIYDPYTHAIVAVGTNGVPRAGYYSDGNNFGPRVGVAWTPDAARKWVIRSGYGIYYDQSSLAPSQGLFFSPPYFNLQTFVPSPQFPIFLENPFPSNYPGFIPNAAFTFQRNLRTPYMQQWNFSVQRQLGSSSVAELAYVGTKGTKLITNRDINQANPSPQPINLRPVPQFADIDAYESRGNSSYNALQASFTQRLHAGLSAFASYTWSKSIDDASGFFSSAGDPNFPQNSNDPWAERGLSNFDISQRFTLAYCYDLPLPAKNALLRGWQTNGVWTFQTGQPFTVTLQPGVDNSNTGIPSIEFGVVDRPNLVGNAHLSNPGPDAWFNTSAFAISPYGTFGNAGRNILTGPGFSSVNVSVIKNTLIREGLNLQFRAEFFNLLNSPNFFLPDSFVGSPSFGRILAAGTPRRVQFGLKLLF
jgi:Carboxypeptidase regulatory-like domain/TonB dependent receptor